MVNLRFAHGAKAKRKAFVWLIAVDLVLTMATDMLLDIHFMVGIATFVAGILSLICVLGKAIGNLKTAPSRTRWLLVIGSVLFWFSDLMVALNMFDGGRMPVRSVAVTTISL